MGIVGVHPVAIILEKLQLDPVRGLDGLLRKMSSELSEGILSDPYWLQDDSDGRCMGPSGFADCGDSTLWILHRKRSLGKGKNILSDLFSGGIGQKKESAGFALQMIDIEVIPTTSVSGESSGIREFVKRQIFERKHGVDLDCLMIDKKGKKDGFYSLKLGSCANSRAWGWRIDGKGVLYHANWVKSRKESFLCLWRKSGSGVSIAPCNLDRNGIPQEQMTNHRLVDFSLVRYRTNPSVPLSNNIKVISTNAPGTPTQKNTKPAINVPHTMSSSESHSKVGNVHPELKPMSSLLFTPLSRERYAVSLLKESNPLMVANRVSFGMDVNEWIPVRPEENVERSVRSPVQQRGMDNTSSKQHLLHLPPSAQDKSLHGIKSSVAPPRKIPVHPYIAVSKNNVWTDPQTGLEFNTDLCEYLGFQKKTYGRHTLMGVGQYTKTMLKVKVYGVGLYVSKRDVLADSNFQPFAAQTTEELQQNHQFYKYLREGNFDKTLFLKLNMQLSVDTICETLDADWSMLTQDRKDAIIEVMHRQHQASKRMLDRIKSPENSSNCSCSLFAPPEYNADTKCCSRGTELVFTWMKNGDLVIRLDGQILEVLEGRKDIGAGIFFEYLNPLNPMSYDSLYHFADGFPFLLAPLAQIKGISVGDMNDHSTEKPSSNNFGIEGVIEFIDQAAVTLSWIQGSANGVASHLSEAQKAMGDSVQGMTKFFKRRGGEAAYHIDLMSSNALNFVIQKTPFIPASIKDRSKKEHSMKDSKESSLKNTQATETTSTILSEQWCNRNLLKGYYSCGNVPRRNDYIFGVGELADEIGALIHPTSNFPRKLFTYTVHLYLMLLFFVSLPESSSSRIVKRKLNTFAGCNRSGKKDKNTKGSTVNLDGTTETEIRISEERADLSHRVIPKSLSYCL